MNKMDEANSLIFERRTNNPPLQMRRALSGGYGGLHKSWKGGTVGNVTTEKFMKKTKIILIVAVCVCLICGGFYVFMQEGTQTETELTEAQKIITKDLESDYPKTPRDVVKWYNRIVQSYYEKELENGELKKLSQQMRKLLDNELLLVNSEDEYYTSVLADRAYYEANEMYIVEANVCASNEIKFITDENNGDKLAYVNTSYFIKRGKDFEKTYQEFVLRQDENGKWKILTFYSVEGELWDE